MSKDRLSRLGARRSQIGHQLRNPYFQTQSNVRHRRAGSRMRSFLLGLSFSLAAIGASSLLGVLLFHPYFTLEAVAYDLSDLLPERQAAIREEVEQSLSKPLFFRKDRKNYALAPVGDIEKRIQSTGSYERVEVKKEFPRGLRVLVRQPTRVFLVSDQSTRVLAEGSGVVLDVLSSDATTSTPANLIGATASSSLLLVRISRGASSTEAFAMGKEALTKNCATLIQLLQKELPKIGVFPFHYEVGEQGTRVTAKTTNGWDVITDPIVDSRAQLERLQAILADMRYKDRKDIKYVDVRYENRVYIKAR